MKNEDLKGIYCIENMTTSKKYIGSTSVCFKVRLSNHRNCLNAHIHKNKYLQNAWVKYGESDFVFSILEIVDDESCILDREQWWINQFDTEELYNINRFATGGLQITEEIIQRRTSTLRKTYADRIEKYNLWKCGELSDSELSEVELKQFRLWISPPWNKGIKYNTTDHLKVPKQVKGDRSKCRETIRNKLPAIEIYTIDGEFIMDFNSAKDIEDWSVTESNNLPIGGRFSKMRGSKSVTYLCSGNINKSCRTGKPYKNLIFKFKSKAPRSSDITQELGELLETP